MRVSAAIVCAALLACAALLQPVLAQEGKIIPVDWKVHNPKTTGYAPLTLCQGDQLSFSWKRTNSMWLLPPGTSTDPNVFCEVQPVNGAQGRKALAPTAKGAEQLINSAKDAKYSFKTAGYAPGQYIIMSSQRGQCIIGKQYILLTIEQCGGDTGASTGSTA